MHLHIYTLLVLIVVAFSSANAIVTGRDSTPIQTSRFLRGDRYASDNDRIAKPPQTARLIPGVEVKDKLKRVKTPLITMDNEMWNKMLTPMFKEFYEKEIHPSRVSKFLAAVRPRQAKRDIAELYKSWYSKRVASRALNEVIVLLNSKMLQNLLETELLQYLINEGQRSQVQ
ncbi:unnamed protein product [Phytophthora fragariaefolia]|uniref:Unnamed protein product n=1 Tax=Phytophthora fragariaefolia TaxID=1490495 RepID=A0A9W6XKA6_9STRA|nr:unnamed protein product [Phytophthora fragariaefolia]